MEKNEKRMLIPMSDQEMRNLYGGFAPPSLEELEAHGYWGKYIICW